MALVFWYIVSHSKKRVVYNPNNLATTNYMKDVFDRKPDFSSIGT